MTEEKNGAEDAKQTSEKKPLFDEVQQLFDMAAFQERQETELDAARVAQKDDLIASCVALAEFGVKEVFIEYDGYGDSGSVEGVFFMDKVCESEGEVPFDWHTEHLVELTEEQDMSVPCKVEGSRTYTPGKGDEPGTWNITYKEAGLKAFFEECAYKWLPGGWEINEGSRGVVKIDVAKRAYSIDHGWRIQEVETETFSFCFNDVEEEAS